MKVSFGIIYEDSRIPALLSIFIKIKAITLFPFVFIRGKGDDILINHERIHLAQQKEMLLLPFYILYVFFYLKNILKYRDSALAYRGIPFEKEAFENDRDQVYLLNRKRFAWINYI